jgi:hypothetical protein
MKEQKKTYGQTIQDHIATNPTMDDDVIEYRREMEKDVIKNIFDTVAKAKATSEYANKDFYIVLLMKVEKIGQSPRTFVLARHSCPTPVYKQSVWKYHHISDNLEFLWAIPDKILYHHIIRNTQKYLSDKECSSLAKYVILMESGELLEWVKRENGDKVDAVIKIQEN